MNTVETIFLGVIQGLTEFLPVSSSGHLVLFQNILGFGEPELLLVSSLHLGTLLAVCTYFSSDFKGMVSELRQLGASTDKYLHKDKYPHLNLALMVMAGSFPTLLIWVFFKAKLESMFGSVTLVGIMFIFTGLILSITKFLIGSRVTISRVGMLAALAVGTAQGLALAPGISRSGATIVCGLIFGLDRTLAGRFSFLLAIPAITGALIMNLDLSDLERVGVIPLVCGVASSAIVGLLSLKLLMSVVRKGRLHYFAPYCLLLGLGVILFSI